MSYVVLARRWRPRKFSDVIGQDVVVKTLQNAVVSNRLAHAYLFTGIRGVGKTTLARLLAMAANCEHGPSPEPCGECSACKGIASASNLDVQEMDAASHTSVDDIREILEAVRYPPASLKFKVYIIDEAHMLSKNAFNALLKTLEEPPPHVLFILATTESEKLPVTVRSRCQRFDLQRLGADKVSHYLSHILSEEQVEHESEAVAAVARAADGSIRDALSLAERVLAFSGKALTSDDVHASLGIVGQDLLRTFSDAVFQGRAREAVDCMRFSQQQGYASRIFLQSAGEVWHQLACVLIDEGLLEFEYDKEHIDWLRNWSECWDIQGLDIRYQILLAGIRDLSLMDERMGAEMLAIRLSSLNVLNPPSQLPPEGKRSPKRDHKIIERKVKAESHETIESDPISESPPDDSSEPNLPLTKSAAGSAYDNWAGAVQAYASIKPGVAARLEHFLCLEFGAKVRLALDEHQQQSLLASDRLAFSEWLGREVYWEPRQEQEGESLAQTWKKQAEKMRKNLWDEAQNDPHVQILCERLDAKLIEVHPPGAKDD
ncbi:MAG: DNA polymerase III subunit gamma/tau [Mariprofundaceae bacterium]